MDFIMTFPSMYIMCLDHNSPPITLLYPRPPLLTSQLFILRVLSQVWVTWQLLLGRSWNISSLSKVLLCTEVACLVGYHGRQFAMNLGHRRGSINSICLPLIKVSSQVWWDSTYSPNIGKTESGSGVQDQPRLHSTYQVWDCLKLNSIFKNLKQE